MRCFVVWCVVLAACEKAAPVTETRNAAEVLARMARAYRETRSYRDHGDLRQHFGGAHEWWETQTFETAFVRPDRLRFHYETKGSPLDEHYTLWSDHGVTRSRWSVEGDKTEQWDSLANAIAAVTGVSSGTALRVTTLLLPELFGAPPRDVPSARIEGTDVIDGHRCFKIITQPRAEPETLWIDAETYALRQVAFRHHFDAQGGSEAFDVDGVVHYVPTLGAQITDAELASN